MALSGSRDYSVTRNSILQEAAELAGIINYDETLETNQTTSYAKTLELMVKSAAWKDVALWTRQDVTVFLSTSKYYYDLGNGGDRAAVDPTVTELGAAADSADTDITVDSITGISDADVIGVEVDDDVMHWTTVNGAPSGTTVALAAGLSDDADEDNKVYAYTTVLAYKPLWIEQAVLRDEYDKDHPVERLTKREYNDIEWKLPDENENNSGDVEKIYYDPKHIGHTKGRLFVYPQPDTVNRRLILTCRFAIQDFDADNDPDFPQFCFEALTTNLAVRLCVKAERAVPPGLAKLARDSLFEARGSSREHTQWEVRG